MQCTVYQRHGRVFYHAGFPDTEKWVKKKKNYTAGAAEFFFNRLQSV